MLPKDKFPVRFGPFVLLRRLGAGGMGSAYLGRHPDVRGLIVIKRLHAELMQDDVIFKRFVHEAEVATHVRDPNVAGVVAMGTVDGEPFLATEYVFGIPVARIVDRIEEKLVEPPPLGIGLHFGLELMSGLVGIHSAVHRGTGEHLGLIHRDIGSRNVLVGFDGRVRIIDLGLGKSVLSDWQTSHQVLAGSPDYMAPEQAMGGRVDGRADVYSAAVTIWELLVGRKRIRADSVAQRLERAVSAQPEALRDVRPEASPRLEAVLKQAMAPDPDLRTPTSSLLREALEEERRALGLKVRIEEVVEWLGVACATSIAKERRLLEEAKGLEQDALQPVRANTQFYVQALSTGEADPYLAYEASPVESARGRGLRETLERLDGSLWAARVSQWVDPERIAAAPTSTKVFLASILLAFMMVVAGFTAWLLTPPPMEAVGLPVKRRPASPRPAPPALVPEAPTETVSAEGDEPDAVDEATRGASKRTSKPGRRKPTVVSEDVTRRKRKLVERLRVLRRQRFEISFQRKLTRVSTRLSTARTHDVLDSIEASLRRLESE